MTTILVNVMIVCDGKVHKVQKLISIIFLEVESYFKACLD